MKTFEITLTTRKDTGLKMTFAFVSAQTIVLIFLKPMKSHRLSDHELPHPCLNPAFTKLLFSLYKWTHTCLNSKVLCLLCKDLSLWPCQTPWAPSKEECNPLVSLPSCLFSFPLKVFWLAGLGLYSSLCGFCWKTSPLSYLFSLLCVSLVSHLTGCVNVYL